MTDTIPDALAADLRDLFLEDQPVYPELDADAIRLKHEISEPRSPRLVILAAEPRRISGQDYTARIPFTIEVISSCDRQSPEGHRLMAGEVDEWLRDIRIDNRRALISSRVYLHDLYCLHPTFAFREEDREQVAMIRGEAIVTLAITEPA